MCLAIPTRIIEKLDNDMLTVTIGHSTSTLSISGALLQDKLEVGDYLIVHAGFAMHKMDATEAEESLRLFREISVAAGDTPEF